MKRATYFEDLQKDVFVIKVEEDGREWLEQRKWHQNDYHYSPDDEFARLKDSGANQLEKYEWIGCRSELLAVSPDTRKWMDRTWTPAV